MSGTPRGYGPYQCATCGANQEGRHQLRAGEGGGVETICDPDCHEGSA